MTAVSVFAVTTTLFSSWAYAAIALDRTRIIMDAENRSVSLQITNENNQLPYLAQGWIEDQQNNKIKGPLTVLPPVQRIEAGDKSQIKVQSLPGVDLLAQDKETLFYFNLREIPPRSDKPNTLQIALQTRIKLFWRPTALKLSSADYNNPVQQKVTLTRIGDKYRINNPTGYYITFVEASDRQGGKPISAFKPTMIAPKENQMMDIPAGTMGRSPVLKYVNDFGGRSLLVFQCGATTCEVIPGAGKG
ncbi:molecular chaperone [Winslowiella iniecta]|uniref:Molecular chaperone n=2 Tax=Winslowiella iniecta TaxID=1560201 RepID=A0A0L7THP2_9GAMM|nr:fimbria/pilus periplasmic chaperone [Winslowiella iniecta]KOC89320.1 molecular chaperone [Winslowiella iniecta]KOC94877.1 molecular chaperone [Winslowiella iniecta]